ncbi:PREDICTED: beta-2-microglobulin [Gekko japonicus]|uniref:Beta-2-microglobulin n=1 Tax=Gekko japonicus TaxID=146911 RepID=A0ABM1JLP4_GEKJA|nr:PREDICTED: beta-2-microglobulin [Gekko japonicus]
MAKVKEAIQWTVLMLAVCILVVEAASRGPKVQVFTRYPPEIGKENTFQCYVDGFHPPKISIELLKNGKPMESQKSDLSFHQDWAFHQLVYANITLDGKTEYACKVEHEALREPQTHKLELEF